MTASSGKFTYWSLLGLPPGSNSDQIKIAFRREARRWHPDLNQNNRNAEERFKWINEAYLVLTDPKKRFEWEIAGKPSFVIKEIGQQAQTANSKQHEKKSVNKNSVFNSAEKFLSQVH